MQESKDLKEIEPDWLLSPEEETAAINLAAFQKERRVSFLKSKNPNGAYSVELDDDEKAAALIQANKHKALKNDLERIAQESRRIAKEAEEQLNKEWDYKRFYRHLQERCPVVEPGSNLIYNAKTALLIKVLCFRFAQDPRYETELGLSLNNGLLLRGPSGTGKSFLPKLIADNPIRPMQILTMHQISKEVKDSGDFTGFKFMTYWNIYIGDLGAELDAMPVINHMGTKLNFFQAWFEDVSDRNPDLLRRLIISTNDNFAKIEEKYGYRTRDRFKQFFDVLDTDGESMRNL